MACGIIEAYLSMCVFNILESTECLIMREIQTKFIFNRLFVIELLTFMLTFVMLLLTFSN